MDYAVLHRVVAPGGNVTKARLIVTGVPDRTAGAAVADAITAAGRAGSYTEAGIPFGNHTIRGEGRGWPKSITDLASAERVPWDELVAARQDVDIKRITLRLPQPVYQQTVDASVRAGAASLNAYCQQALENENSRH